MTNSSDDLTGVSTQRAVDLNRRTIAAYEGYVATYAAVVGDEPFADSELAMHELVRRIGVPASVLEIGSGPGQDADYLERLGIQVRRTDAAVEFVNWQRSRGHDACKVNVLEDPLGGPYDAVLALCVLIHIERILLPSVLTSIYQSLQPNGYLTVSMRVGDGVDTDGNWRTVLWPTSELEKLYGEAQFSIEWRHEHSGRADECWVIHLLRKRD